MVNPMNVFELSPALFGFESESEKTLDADDGNHSLGRKAHNLSVRNADAENVIFRNRYTSESDEKEIIPLAMKPFILLV